MQPNRNAITLQHHGAKRRGAVIVLFTGLLVLLLAMVMWSVDVGWMQLVRTELRSATDAAAKAGAEALARTQDETAARAAVIAIAAKNKVGGKPLVVKPEDIEFGNTTRLSNGKWRFDINKNPRNGVRVNAALFGDKAVPLFFAPAFGHDKFAPDQTATAAHLDQDVVLVVDRSHSMCFDYSGVNYIYPSGWFQYPTGYIKKPAPDTSRWAGLRKGVENFLATASTTLAPPRVALVTFGSDIHPGNDWGAAHLNVTEPAVRTELPFNNGQPTSNYTAINSVMKNKAAKHMLGGTHLSAGIDRARSILNGNTIRPLAKRVIIVFTDGQWNHGRAPEAAAADAFAEGITIHTVTFLTTADQTTMTNVATITGGRHLHANTQAELEAAFRELALTLPVVLTE